jgi:hypothetical protein
MALPRVSLIALIAGLTTLALAAGSAAAAPISPQPDGPSGGNPPADPNPGPSISGTGQVGGTLTGNRGTWGTGTQLSSQWLRCATANSGCETTGDTDLAYALTAADAGKVIKLRVTGRRVVIVELGRRVVDAATGPIAAVPGGFRAPVNARPPEILGAVRQGELLAGSPGVWTGTQPIAFSYVWSSCTSAYVGCIARSSSRNYRPVVADIGRRLALVVTAVNAAGGRQAVVISGPVGKRSAALSSFPRMSPFPVLLIGGRVSGRTTTITSVVLRRLPKGATVNVACTGRGCPLHKQKTVVRKKRKSLRIKRLERRLSAGLKLVITVRQPNRIGKYTRLKLRRGSAPARVDRCVRPGSSKPILCG